MQEPTHPTEEFLDYERLRELISARRSVRRFRQDPVPGELVAKVLDVARLSPSAANSQPWEFVVVDDAETRRRIALAAASIFRPIRPGAT